MHAGDVVVAVLCFDDDVDDFVEVIPIESGPSRRLARGHSSAGTSRCENHGAASDQLGSLHGDERISGLRR
jgi:hypothetical protein